MSATATPAVENPYAQYGLNPDGSPLEEGKVEDKGEEGKEKPTAKPDPRDAKIAALEASLGAANEKLKGLDTYGEKFKVVDKLVKALSGDEDPAAKTYAKVWADLKQIAPPGVRKALELLESDPEALDKLSGSVMGLQQGKLADLNAQAHSHIVGLAKKVFPTKGLTPAEVNEMVFPFERAITDIINNNKQIRERFVSGDVAVVEELFNRLAKSHISGRLKEKASRLQPSTTPKAPPKASGGPGAGKEDEGPKKPDLKTPKGRAEFHKNAVARFFNKRAAAQEEE